MVDAPESSIYDDDELLCSILAQLNAEIAEVIIGEIENALGCFKDADECGKAASAFDDIVALAKLI